MPLVDVVVWRYVRSKMCDTENHSHLHISDILTTPIVTPILKERYLPYILAGFGVAQITLVASGQHGWQCPIKAALGIPCPGCGLTNATVLLLHGKWRESLATHAFAPIFLVGLLLITVVSLLPGRWRAKAVDAVALMEKRTGFAAIVLLALMGYWGMRLLSLV